MMDMINEVDVWERINAEIKKKNYLKLKSLDVVDLTEKIYMEITI